MRGTDLGQRLKRWSGVPWSGSPSRFRRPGARSRSPGPGLGWMAGLVGVLVAGGLLRRRGSAASSKAAFPEAFPLAKAPLGKKAVPQDAPAWPLDDGAWHPCADALARALGVSGEEAEGGPELRPEPPVRRGPSGREHFWSDPHAPFGG